MVAYNQVVNGVSKYIDQEIISKIQGWQKWVLGTGAGMMLSKGSNIFNGIKNHPMIKMMGVVDENDMIDIDSIYNELRKQADKGAITFEAPMLGSITLTKDDVDKLYRLITEG